MPITLNEQESRNRPEELKPYDRLKHTDDESAYLRNRGFRPVVSSNVSAVARDGNVLMIRFHGGATYGYPKSGERYQDLVSAPSKGRWVWDELRRKNVPYYRMGAINIVDDVDDRDMMTPMADTEVTLDILVGDQARAQIVTIEQAEAFEVIVDIERVSYRPRQSNLELLGMVSATDSVMLSIIAGLSLASEINSRRA